MDILYVIGEQSSVRNELKFSLRTLQRNCKNVGRIFIAGYLPEYINTDLVTFIPQEDVMLGYKHNNILNCIKSAVLNSDIADEFLLSSDDHFYMNEADLGNYPYFCKGELKEHIDNVTDMYQVSLLSTYRFLKKYNLPIHNFSWHGNTHFNKKKFIEIMPLVDEAMSIPAGVEPTCLMLNAMFADPKYTFQITERSDRKIASVKDWNKLVQLAEGRDCISFSDEAWQEGCCKQFRNVYHHKSKWEL